VRISTGLVTTFGDVYRLIEFARGFIDRTTREIQEDAMRTGST
jgi:hypothetical protein